MTAYKLTIISYHVEILFNHSLNLVSLLYREAILMSQPRKKLKSTKQSNFTRILFISILYSQKKFIILVTLSFYVYREAINVYYNECVVKSCRVIYLFRTRPLYQMGVSGSTPRVQSYSDSTFL